MSQPVHSEGVVSGSSSNVTSRTGARRKSAADRRSRSASLSQTTEQKASRAEQRVRTLRARADEDYEANAAKAVAHARERERLIQAEMRSTSLLGKTKDDYSVFMVVKSAVVFIVQSALGSHNKAGAIEKRLEEFLGMPKNREEDPVKRAADFFKVSENHAVAIVDQIESAKRIVRKRAEDAVDSAGLGGTVAAGVTIANMMRDPAPVADRLVGELRGQLYRTDGLLDTVWQLLFSKERYDGIGPVEEMKGSIQQATEGLIEEWLGLPPGAFASAAEAAGGGRKGMRTTLITALSMKLTGRPVEGERSSGQGLAGNLSAAAVEGAMNTFFDKLIAGREGVERPKDLVNAIALALTGEMSQGQGAITDAISALSTQLLGRDVSREAGGMVGALRAEVAQAQGKVQSDLAIFLFGRECQEGIVPQLRIQIREAITEVISGASQSLVGRDASQDEGGIAGALTDEIMRRVGHTDTGLVAQLKPEITRAVSEALRELQPQLKQQASETLEALVAEVVDPRLAPILDKLSTFEQAAAEIGKLAGTVNGVAGRFLGTGPKPHNPPLPGVEPPKLAEKDPPQEGGANPSSALGTIPFGDLLDKAQHFFSQVATGAVDAVPRAVFGQILRSLKWGLEQLEARQKGSEPLFRTLIEKVDGLIAVGTDAPFGGRIQQLVAAFEECKQQIESKGIRLTLNGILVPFFSYGSDMATPTLERLLATSALRESGVESESSAENEAKISSEFKSNFSKYVGTRFAYEVLAGLKPPADGFYNGLFAQAKSLSELKTVLFAALDEAVALGKVSNIRVFVTKILCYLIDPITRFFVEPFVDNLVKKVRPLLKNKEMVEKTGALLIDSFADYFGKLIRAYENVADGSGVPGSLDRAVMAELKRPEFSGKRSEKQRHDRVLSVAVDQFAPGFTFANRFMNWLSDLGLSEDSMLNSLPGPLLSLLKALPFVLATVLLSVPQSIMNWGMNWGLKFALSKADPLNGVVDKVAHTVESDLNIKVAQLKAVEAFLVKAYEKLRDAPPADIGSKAGSSIEEGPLGQMVKHLFLAMDYGSSGEVAELRRKRAERENPLINRLSFLGFNLGRLVDEETHKRVVQQLASAYRNAIDEEIIGGQLNALMGMMNGLFDATTPIDPQVLRADADRLKRQNDALLSELIGFAVAKAVEEQFDLSGEKQQEKLAQAIEQIKEKTGSDLAAARETIERLSSKDEAERVEDIQQLKQGAVALGDWVANAYLASGKDELVGQHTEFVKKYTAYAESLSKVDTEGTQPVLDSLTSLEGWQQEMPIPQTANISLFEGQMEWALKIVKAFVRSHAKGQVENLMRLMSKPYNVAGVVNMVLDLFAEERFPFQQG